MNTILHSPRRTPTRHGPHPGAAATTLVWSRPRIRHITSSGVPAVAAGRPSPTRLARCGARSAGSGTGERRDSPGFSSEAGVPASIAGRSSAPLFRPAMPKSRLSSLSPVVGAEARTSDARRNERSVHAAIVGTTQTPHIDVPEFPAMSNNPNLDETLVLKYGDVRRALLHHLHRDGVFCDGDAAVVSMFDAVHGEHSRVTRVRLGVESLLKNGITRRSLEKARDAGLALVRHEDVVTNVVQLEMPQTAKRPDRGNDPSAA